MIQILFLAAIVMSFSLAYSGLVRGEIKISANKPATGTTAKAIGGSCLAFGLALVAVLVWYVLRVLGHI